MDNTCVSVNCINSKSFIVFSESYAELKYILKNGIFRVTKILQ
ncbi:hypothetical protein T4C_4873 [Trichinella pseudospiralis]|uniref:Uncharacterized protein n=1 Tax=Trichinella pseudospiralis TaxID=6337 RepID=A0A0V1G9P8_TRIPS|nr:hypothetical protein T4C_4873 [Trichinella pseudospiralis]